MTKYAPGYTGPMSPGGALGAGRGVYGGVRTPINRQMPGLPKPSPAVRYPELRGVYGPGGTPENPTSFAPAPVGPSVKPLRYDGVGDGSMRGPGPGVQNINGQKTIVGGAPQTFTIPGFQTPWGGFQGGSYTMPQQPMRGALGQGLSGRPIRMMR